MTTFREYRESTASDAAPTHQVPKLPSAAVEFQGERAGFVTRAVAAGIDVFLVFLTVLGTIAALWMLSFIVDPVTSTSPETGQGERIPSAVAMVLYGYALNVVYWTVGWATGGRTIGNLIMGVRVVNFRGGRGQVDRRPHQGTVLHAVPHRAAVGDHQRRQPLRAGRRPAHQRDLRLGGGDPGAGARATTAV